MRTIDHHEAALCKLVTRVTFGANARDVEEARTLGFEDYISKQLAIEVENDASLEQEVEKRYPVVALGANDLIQLNQHEVYRQFVSATLYRAVFSRNQLLERMVEFWTDHFSIWFRKAVYLKTIDDRVVIRRHALGRFSDLLFASAHSPAMLEYLDNTRSVASHPNDNYARELLELHTLGVDGGYTEDDVKALARIFTGWTFRHNGEFHFDATQHDHGPKQFLTRSFAARIPEQAELGQLDGQTALAILSHHPSTAEFVAGKLCRYLLEYEPPRTLIGDVANVFRRTNGDIAAMIRMILTPLSVASAAPKFRRPFHYAVATLKGMSPSPEMTEHTASVGLGALGQPLYLWEAPNGYPEMPNYWETDLLSRWNFAANVVQRCPGVASQKWKELNSVSPGTFCDELSQAFFCGAMSQELRRQLTVFLSAGAGVTRRQEACSLALSSPEFMWY